MHLPLRHVKFTLRHPEKCAILIGVYRCGGHTPCTAENGKLQADAVAAAAAASDVVCACRLYVRMSTHVCPSVAMEMMLGREKTCRCVPVKKNR